MLHHSFPNTWSISPRVVDFRRSKTPRTLTYLWARWFADVGLILLGVSASCGSHKTLKDGIKRTLQQPPKRLIEFGLSYLIEDAFLKAACIGAENEIFLMFIFYHLIIQA